MTDLLTRQDLMKKLKVSESMIVRLEKKGLPVIRVSSDSPRYNYDLVINWLSENQNNQHLNV